MSNSNFVIFKNNKVFANVSAETSKVDGMGARLVDAAGQVVFHAPDHSFSFLKASKAKVGASVE